MLSFHPATEKLFESLLQNCANVFFNKRNYFVCHNTLVVFVFSFLAYTGNLRLRGTKDGFQNILTAFYWVSPCLLRNRDVSL